MAKFRDRLPMLFEIRSGNRQLLRNNAKDLNKDRTGVCSASLIGDLRFFGIAEYLLNHDVHAFQSQLREAAIIRQRVFDRIDAGELIDDSYNSILSYIDVLNSLAAGDFSVAFALANRILETPIRSDIHEFDEAIGRALCSVVAEVDESQLHVVNFISYCRSKHTDFLEYANLLLAVLQKNAASASDALGNMVIGHRRQSLHGGLFADSIDEALCVWGIGVANLARHKLVLVVSPDEALIPSELLVA